MKTMKLVTGMLGLLLVTFLLQSCLDDDGYSLDDFAIEVVTVVPISNNSYYLRRNDGTTLWPAAAAVNYRPAKQQRIWANYTLLGEGGADGYDYWVKVNGITEILTKEIADNLGEENDEIYGTDAVAIHSCYVGDGYLNIRYSVLFGGEKAHFINLVKTDENTPYVLELRHNAYDDPPQVEAQGRVAFNLRSLPGTAGETVKLKIIY
ncbi:MAG: NigD-like protein, partial [Tannerellaceae bacterium]|nr:NigD-like protein [Tannerellaceae bacterium]